MLFTATLHADGEDGAGRKMNTLQSLQKRVPFAGKPAIIDLTAAPESDESDDDEDGACSARHPKPTHQPGVLAA